MCLCLQFALRKSIRFQSAWSTDHDSLVCGLLSVLLLLFVQVFLPVHLLLDLW